MLCITPPELTHLLTTSLNSLPSISIPLPSCPSNHHSILLFLMSVLKKKKATQIHPSTIAKSHLLTQNLSIRSTDYTSEIYLITIQISSNSTATPIVQFTLTFHLSSFKKLPNLISQLPFPSSVVLSSQRNKSNLLKTQLHPQF